MSEDPFQPMKELLAEISRASKESEVWFHDQELDANKTIDTYGKLRDNKKLEPATRLLAGKTTENACQIMVILADQEKTLTMMNRLGLTTMYAIMRIDNELKQLVKPSELPTKIEKEKISSLEKELARLKRVTKRWKPIIDDMKEGRERTRRYLADHR